MKNWRVNIVLCFFFFLGAGILAKLYDIQILKAGYYGALAQGQIFYNIEERIKNSRGEIFFKDGEPLAVNAEWPLVVVSPREITEKDRTAEDLALFLNLDRDSVLEKLATNDIYTILKKRIDQDEAKKIKEACLKGVYLKKEAGRYYPHEELASQVVGFLNAEKEGQYGLEEYYDGILSEDRKKSGDDITLTLDYAVQFTAEKLLKDAKTNLNIEGGQVIVMEAETGKIRALANYPNFNPNQYSKVSDLNVFQNGATQKIFEPGSIFKPITMVSALDQGVITPLTTYEDSGVIKIGKWSIYNYEQRVYPGKLTMTNVLEKSINTGAVFAEQKLGHVNFMKYIENFGVFEPTGIDLKEVYSENKELKKGYEVNYATAAFGQGLEMTPLQLVRAFSAITNSGKLVTPYLVEKVSNGMEEKIIDPKVSLKEIVSPKAASQLASMMVSVIENGYGKPAKIANYYIAGKTGTSQVPWSSLNVNRTGYSEKTWQSFIGFAPAFSPQFIILVKLDNPQTKSAEFSAVPLFKQMAKYIIDYYQIPPDYE
ncbi:MAG: penicillin-binding protein 2 [Candidatus Pacebacteria bacterium]|nr:penicillin-binding protein 2 [Candidatus Paceibacterota bacterium]